MEEQLGKVHHALILKGGGVKGIALAGAAHVLERYYSFDTYTGSSAGAIGAILLGAGFSPLDLKQALCSVNFRSFLDANLPSAVWNLLTKYGLYESKSFQIWIRNMLRDKLGVPYVRMEDLPVRTVVFGSDRRGLVEFDSEQTNKDSDADFAARVSMSFPGFFTPCMINGRRVYDGGLLNNFPVERFKQRFPTKPFIGLYIGPLPDSKSESTGPIFELLESLLSQNEAEILKKHHDDIVVIDPGRISTLQFSLTEDEKEYLWDQGRLAAFRFLSRQEKISREDRNECDDLSEIQRKREHQFRRVHTKRVLRRVALLAQLIMAIGFMAIGFMVIGFMVIKYSGIFTNSEPYKKGADITIKEKPSPAPLARQPKAKVNCEPAPLAPDAGFETGRIQTDVDKDGCADYCRIVGDRAEQILCTYGYPPGTAAKAPSYTDSKYAGFEGFRWWLDFDKDDVIDYCRIVGDPGVRALVCQPFQNGELVGPHDRKAAPGVEMGEPNTGRWTDVNKDGYLDWCRISPLKGLICRLNLDGDKLSGEDYKPPF